MAVSCINTEGARDIKLRGSHRWHSAFLPLTTVRHSTKSACVCPLHYLGFIFFSLTFLLAVTIFDVWWWLLLTAFGSCECYYRSKNFYWSMWLCIVYFILVYFYKGQSGSVLMISIFYDRKVKICEQLKSVVNGSIKLAAIQHTYRYFLYHFSCLRFFFLTFVHDLCLNSRRTLH